jgi:hypothetical protein
MLAFPGLAATNCSSVAGCRACYDIIGCHYCSGECHAYGSIHGCIFGDSCEVDEGCFRVKPESVPVEGPTFGDLIGIMFVMGIVFTCAAMTVWGSGLLKDAVSTTTEEDDENYVPLRRMSKQGRQLDDLDERDVEGAQWVIPKKKSLVTPFRAVLIHRVCKCCCVFTVGATIVIGLLAAINFPVMPTYNVCDERFDWNSLFSSLQKVSIQGDFNVVLSLKNPNRFTFAATELRVEFVHDNAVVGSSLDTKELVLPPHTISDYVLKVSFRPSISQALSMQRDFSSGKLFFTINGIVKGYTTPLGYNYPFTQRVEKQIIRIGDSADQSMCKCTSRRQR